MGIQGNQDEIYVGFNAAPLLGQIAVAFKWIQKRFPSRCTEDSSTVFSRIPGAAAGLLSPVIPNIPFLGLHCANEVGWVCSEEKLIPTQQNQ